MLKTRSYKQLISNSYYYWIYYSRKEKSIENNEGEKRSSRKNSENLNKQVTNEENSGMKTIITNETNFSREIINKESFMSEPTLKKEERQVFMSSDDSVQEQIKRITPFEVLNQENYHNNHIVNYPNNYIVNTNPIYGLQKNNHNYGGTQISFPNNIIINYPQINMRGFMNINGNITNYSHAFQGTLLINDNNLRTANGLFSNAQNLPFPNAFASPLPMQLHNLQGFLLLPANNQPHYT